MIRRPPRSTRTDTLFPYTTLFRSGSSDCSISIFRRRGGGKDRDFFVNFLSEAVVPRSTHSRVDPEDLSVRPFCVGSHAFPIEIWIIVVVDEALPFGPDFLGMIGSAGLFVSIAAELRLGYECVCTCSSRCWPGPYN